MFEELGQYSRIYVTGPQRAGTTILSKMIAHDTGYTYIGEEAYNWDRKKFHKLKNRRKIVIHCPLFCHIIHLYSDCVTIIVMTIRPVDEIEQSQKRVCWDGEKKELAKYGEDHGIISQIKYKNWEDQKKKIDHYKEIAYHSLRPHPMWRSRRKAFFSKQTSYKSNSMIGWL